MTIKRDVYLKQLINRMHNGLIKVITGLRRSGKSFLLFNIFKQYLIEIGIPNSHIIEIKFDEIGNEHLLNRKKLIDYINNKIVDKDKYYVLLDEIQLVKKFEPVLIQISRIENVDVYVTGSNSKFLSTDIDTQLNGKNDPIHIYPLSFEEFSSIYSNSIEAWNDYKKYGGLPQITKYKEENDKINYLHTTFNELYLKDIISRYKVLYEDEIKDLSRVLSSSIGSYVSVNKIVNTIKSLKKTNLKYETIARYIKHLESAFVINSIERFDLKGRKYIGANKKYYFEDIGIRNSLTNYRQIEDTHILENVIYNELRFHGYNVDIGIIPIKNAETTSYSEIDFVANKGMEQYLIQSCVTLSNETIVKREKKELSKITSCTRKYIVTLDSFQTRYIDDNGIVILNLFDFLKEI